jgi:hypothetical protein
MGKNRKGMALITVVLIAALFLISIIGISAKVITEKKVSNARAHSQRALAVAETGLADTVQKVRTDEGLKETLAGGGGYDPGEEEYESGISSVTSTYRVKIVPDSDGYNFYSLGTVKTSGNDVLERKVITVKYSGNFPISDFGLFSASNIKVQNGTVNADIFANTSIDFRNDDELNGTAYCPTPGGITGGLSDDKKNYNCRNIDFPEVDLDQHKALWEAFLNGEYPYNGTLDEFTDPDGDEESNYPNTGYSEAWGDIHAYIVGKLYTTSEAATQSNFESFFSDIKNLTSPEAAYLGSFINKGTLVYYIKPDEHKDTVTINGNLYGSPPFLEGIVIIEGNLDLVGGAQIGVDPYKTSILVTVTVDVGAGGATINGLLHIEGVGTHGNDPALSIKGTGGLVCNGSIVAKGTINLNSQLTVTWERNKIYEEEIKPGVEEGQESNLSPDPSSWKEISYEESPFSP